MNPNQPLNIGACIYCGDTNPPLTREHILPRGLGGNVSPEGFKSALVLRNATCEPCRVITSEIETACLRSNFNYARARLGLKRKDRSGERLRTWVEMPDGSKGYREVDSSDVMGGVVIPSYREAGALTGRQLTNDEPCPCDYHITITAPGRGDVYEQSAAVAIETMADAKIFARVLAKIALGVAVARFGLNAFEPTVRNFILNNANECGYWVGGFAGTQRLESGYWAHRIHVYTRQVGADTFIIVEIQLFAEFVMPSNYVVVGRAFGDLSVPYFPTQEITWRPNAKQS